MAHLEVSHPIATILDGSNYISWTQAMQSFLKGHKYSSIIPTIKTDESGDSFADHLDVWDSKYHHIITWIHNYSIPLIHQQLD